MEIQKNARQLKYIIQNSSIYFDQLGLLYISTDDE